MTAVRPGTALYEWVGGHVVGVNHAPGENANGNKKDYVAAQ